MAVALRKKGSKGPMKPSSEGCERDRLDELSFTEVFRDFAELARRNWEGGGGPHPETCPSLPEEAKERERLGVSRSAELAEQ